MTTINTASSFTPDLISALDSDKKKFSRYSVVLSIAAHIVLVLAVKVSSLLPASVAPAEPENYIDLGYQQFDEVPEVVQRAPTQVTKDVVVDKSEPVTTKSEEMQDQSSDIQGLQKELRKPMTTTSSNYTTVPYYKIKPKYPKDALESGVEGHVMMAIDIAPDGSVENIKVTGGEKIGTFETAATRSVAKWKYKPFTDDNGKPIEKKNYLVRVDFKIKDELTNN